MLKKPTPAEKYEELMVEGAPLPVLPVHYKTLLKLFIALDEALLFFKKRHKVCVFEELACSVENSTKKRFSKGEFGQILTVSPHSYTYEWRNIKGARGYSLVVDVPDRYFELNVQEHKRQDDFKKLLHEKTKEHHTKFLQRVITKRPGMKEYLEDYKENQMGGWYHEFDPHSVPQIETTTLRPKPVQEQRSESVSDFMKRNRSLRKKFTLANLSGSCTPSTNEKEFVSGNALASLKKSKAQVPETPESKKTTANGVPMDLFTRIQSREKLFNEETKQKQVELKQNLPQMRFELLLKMSETVKSVFSVHNRHSLPLKTVLAQLTDSCRGRYESADSLKTEINNLCMASPNWLSLINLQRGEFIKINRKYDKKSVRVDIHKWVHQQQEQ